MESTLFLVIGIIGLLGVIWLAMALIPETVHKEVVKSVDKTKKKRAVKKKGRTKQ